MFWESKIRQLRAEIAGLRELLLKLTGNHLQLQTKVVNGEVALDTHKQRMDNRLAAIEKRLDRIEGVH